MTDDPRDVLSAAGVECAEVDKVGLSRGWYDPRASHQHALNIIEIDDADILALARLAAKYRGMLRLAWDDLDDDFPDEVSEGDFDGYVADLNRRWEEHNA